MCSDRHRVSTGGECSSSVRLEPTRLDNGDHLGCNASFSFVVVVVVVAVLVGESPSGSVLRCLMSQQKQQQALKTKHKTEHSQKIIGQEICMR